MLEHSATVMGVEWEDTNYSRVWDESKQIPDTFVMVVIFIAKLCAILKSEETLFYVISDNLELKDTRISFRFTKISS